MSYWEEDPFKTHLVAISGPKEFGYSEAATRIINGMAELIHNEGVHFYHHDYEGDCPNTGSPWCHYDPIDPRISIKSALPWPQFRWYMALTVGYHFTRHHYYELSSREEWKAAATAWATAYLGTAAANLTVGRWKIELPDNAEPPEPEPEPPKPESEPLTESQKKLQLRTAKHRNRCHGQAKDGTPCAIACKGGTAFCHHHQDQAGPTLSTMGAFVDSLAATLHGGEHA